jgi:predicted ATPase
MKINSFSFSSNSQNLHIEKVSFDKLNLLVGDSGAGKTITLRTLDLICDVAKGKDSNLDDIEWSIDFAHFGQHYRWDLKTSNSIDDPFSSEQGQAEILEEKLIEFKENQEIEILYRTKSKSKFNNIKLPKLKRTESAISLLAEEDSIAPVASAFKRFIFNEIPQRVVVTVGFDPSITSEPEFLELNAKDGYKKFTEIFALSNETVIKAYYLEKLFPQMFNEIKEIYTEIFPSVRDVRVTANTSDGIKYSLLFEIKEDYFDNWISQMQISSGMYRTLIYLIEIFAAPEESVIIIDEFENSLGINCMPQLTELILDKSPELQFILTSHHPYIINNIPWKTWQLVSRTNGTIRSRKAVDIPTLNTASSLDKFTQLINLLENEAEAA